MGGETTRLLETLCDGCVIRLLYFPVTATDRWGRIDVQLISNHRSLWNARWSVRVRNAWAALRNRYDWSGFDFDTEREAKAFRDAFAQAVAETWLS
jgi:hypothetical protein